MPSVVLGDFNHDLLTASSSRLLRLMSSKRTLASLPGPFHFRLHELSQGLVSKSHVREAQDRKVVYVES